MLLIFTSSFANFLVAGFESDQVAGALCTLFLIIMFSFNGVLATPEQLPGFWIWVYRVNPFTYIINGFLGTALANAPITCATHEILTFASPANQTCGQYLAVYIDRTGGYLINPELSNGLCEFCPMNSTNTFLKSLNIEYADRWKSFGYLWVYVVFNIVAALTIYWLVRVPNVKEERIGKENEESRIETRSDSSSEV